jgi:hypothetical protein
MPKTTLETELDKLEKIILELSCMGLEPANHPPLPDGRPYRLGVSRDKVFDCPHCKALKTIARIRAEIGK